MKTTKQISANIRLVAKPECESYWDVYGVSDDPEFEEALKLEIESGGLWYVSSDYRCPCCGAWVRADSIGMIIGDPFDPSNNCYLPDLIAQAESDLASRAVTGICFTIRSVALPWWAVTNSPSLYRLLLHPRRFLDYLRR